MMARMIAAWMLVAALGPIAAAQDDGKKPSPKEDRFELVIPGQILKEDPIDKIRNVPGKVHAIKLLKDKSYVLDLVSMDFDSFLRIEDSAGNQLAQDDDGGGNLNSRIRYTATKDDTFLIYATTLAGGEGSYTLSVKEVVIARVKPLPLAAPDAKKPAEAAGVLEGADPLEPVRNRPGRIHAIPLKKGKTYVIDLTSPQFDTYLYLHGPNNALLGQDDDGGEGLNSRIEFTAADDGVYQITASTFNGQTGPYSLRVAEKE